MEWKEKVEQLEVTIKQLLLEEGEEGVVSNSSATKPTSSSLDDSFIAVVDDAGAGEDVCRRRLLLKKLHSQLETLKAVGKLQLAGSSDDPKELPSPAIGKVETKNESVKSEDGESSYISGEKIVRELRKVKKQNLITHCLLTAMIVLTVVWQFSEVTLILKVKDRVSHPFRSVNNVIEGMLKNPNNNGQDGEEQPSEIPKIAESSALLGLKIPNLPQMELPDFSSPGNAN